MTPVVLPTVLKTPSSPLWTRRRLSNAPSTKRRDSSASSRPGTPTVPPANAFNFEPATCYEDPPQTKLISPVALSRTRASSAIYSNTWVNHAPDALEDETPLLCSSHLHKCPPPSMTATIRRPLSALDNRRFGPGGIPATLLQKQSYSFSPSTMRRRFSLGQG